MWHGRLGLIALTVLIGAPSSSALAAPLDAPVGVLAAPTVTLTAPVEGAVLSDPRPAFVGTAGTATGDEPVAEIAIRAGATTVQTFDAPVNAGGAFNRRPDDDLDDGAYTVTASQRNGDDVGVSAPPRAFTIDTAEPQVTLTTPADGARVADRTPRFAGTAGTAAGDAAAVTVELYSGGDASGSPLLTLPTSRGADGAYAVEPTDAQALEDGEQYTAVAVQGDHAGLIGASSEHTFRVDVTAPTVTLTEPDDATLTNDPRPTFGGRAGTAGGDEDAVEVQLHEGDASGPIVGRLDANPSATGAYDVVPGSDLADGAYTAIAVQRDSAGNTGSSSGVRLTIDTAQPEARLTVPADGTATNDGTPRFEGVGGTAANDEAEVQVRIWRGGDASGAPLLTLDAARAANGAFDVTPGVALLEGQYTVRVRQADAAGNVGDSPSTRFRVDQTPPDVTLDPVAAVLGDATPTLRGTAEPGDAVLELFAGGDTSGSPVRTQPVEVDAGGDFAGTVDPGLADGTYTARVRQADQAGNSGTSPTRTFRVDTAPPAVLVTEPRAGSGTANNTPTIRGTAEPGDLVVELFDGTDVSGEPDRTLPTTADSVGAFSASVSPALSEGGWTVRVRQTDEAGNTGASPLLTFQIDTGPPQVSLTGPGATTRERTPRLSGTAEPGAVRVSVSAGPSVSTDPARVLRTNAGPDGRFSIAIDPGLLDGTYTAEARQVDSAGNEGASRPVTFSIDASAPTLALTAPAIGSILPTSRPVLSGRAGTAAGDGATVRVVVEGSTRRTIDAQRGPDGLFRAVPEPPLPDGGYRAYAVQGDAAGNASVSGTVAFVLDTRPPAGVLTAGPVPIRGGTRDVSFEFGADEAAAFRCELDGKLISNRCRSPLQVRRLRAGRHVLRVTAFDAAGNADPTPATLRFAIDVAAPRMQISQEPLVDSRGRVRIFARCPKGQSRGPCAGTLQLRRGKRSVLRSTMRVRVPVGTGRWLRGQLTPSYRRALAKSRRLRVSTLLVAADGRGNVGRARSHRTLRALRKR